MMREFFAVTPPASAMLFAIRYCHVDCCFRHMLPLLSCYACHAMRLAMRLCLRLSASLMLMLILRAAAMMRSARYAL